MRRSFILAGLAAILLGCATGSNPRIARDPDVDLKSYKTFAFYDRSMATDAPRYSSLLDKRLKVPARLELEKRGYAYSEENPDLRVNMVTLVDRSREIHGAPTGTGFIYRPLPAATKGYREGTLTIDLVDVRKNALVWQGVADARFDEQSARDPEMIIENAVKEIFNAFPDGPRR